MIWFNLKEHKSLLMGCISFFQIEFALKLNSSCLYKIVLRLKHKENLINANVNSNIFEAKSMSWPNNCVWPWWPLQLCQDLNKYLYCTLLEWLFINLTTQNQSWNMFFKALYNMHVQLYFSVLETRK